MSLLVCRFAAILLALLMTFQQQHVSAEPIPAVAQVRAPSPAPSASDVPILPPLEVFAIGYIALQVPRPIRRATPSDLTRLTKVVTDFFRNKLDKMNLVLVDLYFGWSDDGPGASPILYNAGLPKKMYNLLIKFQMVFDNYEASLSEIFPKNSLERLRQKFTKQLRNTAFGNVTKLVIEDRFQ